MWGEKENKSEIFGGNVGIIGLIINALDKIGLKFIDLIGIKKCKKLFGGYERYFLTFILPVLLIYFEIKYTEYFLYFLFLLNFLFFIKKIKKII